RRRRGRRTFARGGAPEHGLNTTNTTVTLTAPTDVDVELPMDGLARDLDLELLGRLRGRRTFARGGAPEHAPRDEPAEAGVVARLEAELEEYREHDGTIRLAEVQR